MRHGPQPRHEPAPCAPPDSSLPEAPVPSSSLQRSSDSPLRVGFPSVGRSSSRRTLTGFRRLGASGLNADGGPQQLRAGGALQRTPASHAAGASILLSPAHLVPEPLHGVQKPGAQTSMVGGCGKLTVGVAEEKRAWRDHRLTAGVCPGSVPGPQSPVWRGRGGQALAQLPRPEMLLPTPDPCIKTLLFSGLADKIRDTHLNANFRSR